MALRHTLRQFSRKSCMFSPRLLQARNTSSSAESHATSFGFRQVSEEQKGKLVGEVFESVASKYDVMNDLMSLGLHRLWKDRLVSKLCPFPGMQHLDVAGGTGDVAFDVLEAINRVEQRSLQVLPAEADAEDETRVYVCDINPAMLEVGKQRAKKRGLAGLPSLQWVEGNAEHLDFKDESMDGYTIAFGIRNVTHIDRALKEAHRYDMYSFAVIPAVGQYVAGDRNSYQYLVESARKFPTQERFASMIADAGFQDVQYENLVGGVVAIHSGFKL
ncbi:hypothetical protein MPTK1_6g01110 [Marchantia polymorpha subsp. ruderalis]|uniref:2-methoxy-6-polyprenyl-1,4-benzoquinol methylase, mitochondrial n=2 Tax=Marchantia polymorpha TaxID=3197 RepID=A0A176WBI0_MARPO|nr:hypothetical protein AXG93_977s1140 [Marchantia polymorpha subsp. ruderalis]PTQ38311.1 hypothetical protein MARPO_0052s0093 [Marchantia polymorpha]BBN13137.1 hypothetical protein Mp_6g01110 [Marchantia polymorpha subsp. ruderalis]|eukprot:PTQ38311.1 hypothetical protein MARPO_0052s0093 [Marchantia polymorpha]